MLKFDKVDYRSKKISKDKGIQGHYIKNRELNPWVAKIPWSRSWESIFLTGEFHGQENLVGYIPWGHKESDTTG